MLIGRDTEQSTIDRLLARVREGGSGALVMRGAAGVGKTALVDYAADAADGLRVLRGTGIESEMELPFSGLHLLLGPGLDRIPDLPEPQRLALQAAFGLVGGGPGDRLLVGLAVLSLLAELAEDGPLVCLVDDAHWLDRASAEALLFAARRLHAEGVALVFAARDTGFAAAGLTEIRVDALTPGAAAALLDGGGRVLEPGIRLRVLAEAQGNPLALLELPAAVESERFGGAGAAPGALPLTDRLRRAFHGEVSRMPAATRTVLGVAALAGTDDLHVILRAAAYLGVGPDALDPAMAAGLIRANGEVVDFRHPLVRAAIHDGLPLAQRLATHDAFCRTLDPRSQADQRAWHLGAAATAPNELVATELEDSATRARERRGTASAVAAYERAAQLSTDPDAEARRLTLAAESAFEVGDFERVRQLLKRAAARTVDREQRARANRIRAGLRIAQGAHGDAARLLIEGAGLVAPDQPLRAGRLLIEATHSAWHIADERLLAQVGHRIAVLRPRLRHDDRPVFDVARAIIDLATGQPPDPADDLPDLAAAHGRHDTLDDVATVVGVALIVGQDREAYDIARTAAAEARARGDIGRLPKILAAQATTEILLGRYREAAASAEELLRIEGATGSSLWSDQANGVLAIVAAIEGDEERCRTFARDARATETVDGEGPGSIGGPHALALLDLGYGRIEAAQDRWITLAAGSARYLVLVMRSAADLIEASVRSGRPEHAEAPLARLEAWARTARRPCVEALAARGRALLASDAEAEFHYRTALRLHARDIRPFDQARTALLYGEWLRRNRRSSDARRHLRDAQAVFEDIGAVPWTERAGTELGATVASRPRHTGATGSLTSQELHVVRLAAQGLSNKDIAAQLFLSPRTVGHHLYKAYPKLGVTSRNDLHRVEAIEAVEADEAVEAVED
ncbi:ATP-binding protein [Embleya sp. NBC_00896]|uniref:ATP-binding protein n=1 Tax=Embleya sp. NBC_00896 TaxID=2975961 RepID=UPI00386B7262|nr:AAA family ATPase [Embleya sp. NBC_00896]